MAQSASFEPYALSLLHIVAGFTFSLHGYQKFLGAFGGLSGHGAAAHFLSLMWFAGVIETIGGALIFLGLYTRCVAFVLCGEMAVAYFHQHAPRGLWPLTNGGELAVLYCFIFLLLASAGAGPWSLDLVLRKK